MSTTVKRHPSHPVQCYLVLNTSLVSLSYTLTFAHSYLTPTPVQCQPLPHMFSVIIKYFNTCYHLPSHLFCAICFHTCHSQCHLPHSSEVGWPTRGSQQEGVGASRWRPWCLHLLLTALLLLHGCPGQCPLQFTKG